jgi:hypothetical protein
MSEREARRVIADALTARHEELRGEASPIDFDGASQILRALSTAGFSVLSAGETQEAFGKQARPMPTQEQIAEELDIRAYPINGVRMVPVEAALEAMQALLAIDSLTPGVEW